MNNGFLKSDAVGRIFKKINDRLGEEKDINGKYGKFRKHSLRKLFSSTYRKNITKVLVNADKTSEIDILSIFTGHVPPNESNSKGYEAIPEDSHESYLRQTYFGLIPYLSIKPTEVRVVNSKEAKNFDNKINALEEESRMKDVQYQRELEEKEKEINNLKRQLAQTINKVEETSNAMQRLKLKKNVQNITNAISAHYNEYFRKDDEKLNSLIISLAVNYSMENKNEFDFSESYLNSLIKKMMIKTSLSSYSIDEQLAKLGIEYVSERDSTLLHESVNEIILFIENNDELMDILGEINYSELENLIKIHVINQNHDLTNLSDEDRLKIVELVLMDYL